MPVALGLGSKRSSVEDWNVLRASFSEYSEKFEDLRRDATGLGASVDVEKRFVGGRCRNWADSSTVSALRTGLIAGDIGLFTMGASSAMTITRFDQGTEGNRETWGDLSARRLSPARNKVKGNSMEHP